MSNFVSKENLMEENKAINNAFAKKTGAYPNLTAGNLVDSKATGVERMFNLDTSCGDASIEDDGSAVIKSLEGNTIVANQLVSPTNDNVSSSTNNSGYSEIIDGTDKQIVALEIKGKTELFKDTTEDLNYIINQITNDKGDDYYHAGDQLIINYTYNDTEYECPMNVVDHHDSTYSDNGTDVTKKALWLEWQYSTPLDTAFDPAEAMCTVSSNGLAAGTYYFTSGSTVYQFTLTDALTEGQQLRYNEDKNLIYIYADNKTASTGNVTLSVVTEPTGTNLGTLGGTDYDSAIASSFLQDDNNHILNVNARILYGYNRWSQSYIRQYLNSSGTGWWTSQNIFDRAPTNVDSIVGFLSGLPADLVAKLKPTKLWIPKNTSDGGGFDIVYDKIFTHSKKQMCWASDGEDSNTYQWEYYRNLANSIVGTGNNFQNSQTYPGLIRYAVNAKTTAKNIWTTSASRGYTYTVWRVISSGYCHYSYANTSSYRVLPACVLYAS